MSLQVVHRVSAEDDGIVEICMAIPSSLWSLASLRQVIETATQELRDVPKLLSVVERGGYGYRLQIYEGTTIPDQSDRSLGDPFDEEIVFWRAAMFHELDEVTLQYIDVILAYNLGSEKVGYQQELWHDEQHQAGCFAIEPLAFRDVRFVSNYAQFLRGNDMDHEVFQEDVIDGLIEKWGWCEETLELFAARCTFATGQGSHQIAELRDKYALIEYIQSSENAEKLRQMIVRGILLNYSTFWGQNSPEDRRSIANSAVAELASQPSQDLQDTIEELCEGCDFPFDQWLAPSEQGILDGLQAIQRDFLQPTQTQ
ncbi:MAG: hypothetical protein KY445_01740 [Armatimonadetes bacterium]|nr:hypothetical protein [Armatimonadota bacterium]